MNKAPRFLIEYANYQLKQIDNSSLTESEKKSAQKAVMDSVRHYQIGIVTLSEAMRIILAALE